MSTSSTVTLLGVRDEMDGGGKMFMDLSQLNFLRNLCWISETEKELVPTNTKANAYRRAPITRGREVVAESEVVLCSPARAPMRYDLPSSGSAVSPRYWFCYFEKE